MLQVGQKYHKDGVQYTVKTFKVDGIHLKITLINDQTKEDSKLNMTITRFVTDYSKLPDGKLELVRVGKEGKLELIKTSPS